MLSARDAADAVRGAGKEPAGTPAPVRSSNIELLWIACMLLICLHHFCVHGPWTGMPQSGAYSLQVLSMCGKVGVDCFVLITGYFMILSCAKTRSLVRLELQVLFYSVGIFAVFALAGSASVGRAAVLDAVLPVTTSRYWFITAYVGVFALSPLINRALAGMPERSYCQVLAAGFVLFSLVRTVLVYRGNPFASSVLWFAYLYAVGGYLRLHGAASTSGAGRVPARGADWVSALLNPAGLVREVGPSVCLVATVVLLAASPRLAAYLNSMPSLSVKPLAYMAMDSALVL